MDLPIDIHSSKLLDWLVSRRHCNRQWLKIASEIRALIANLTDSSLDEEDIDADLVSLLRQPTLHYWHCQSICDSLKRLEAEKHSVFFGYSSRVIKKLDDILKLYRKDNVYLADSARMLNKLVHEDVPYLKKQLERCRKKQSDAERKKTELLNSSVELKEKFCYMSKQLELSEEFNLGSVRAGIIRQTTEIVDWFNTVFMPELKNVEPVLNFYVNYVSFIGKAACVELGGPCPMLSYLLTKGNTTCYEYYHKKAPKAVEEFKITFPESLLACEAPEECDEVDADIDWDIVADPASMNEMEIDFGIQEIDFEIEVDNGTPIDIVSIESSPVPDNDETASGEMARCVLDCLDLREELLDDLHEIESFLLRLKQEVLDHSNTITQQILESASSSLKTFSAGMISDYRAKLEKVINLLTNSNRNHVMLIRSSPNYLANLLKSFSDLRDRSIKATQLANLSQQRVTEAVEEEQVILAELGAIRSHLKELKQHIQADISQKYSNRRVNLMGEINAV